MASAVNILAGGEMMDNTYINMIEQLHSLKPDKEQEKATAEEIKINIMNRINSMSEV